MKADKIFLKAYSISIGELALKKLHMIYRRQSFLPCSSHHSSWAEAARASRRGIVIFNHPFMTETTIRITTYTIILIMASQPQKYVSSINHSGKCIR